MWVAYRPIELKYFFIIVLESGEVCLKNNLSVTGFEIVASHHLNNLTNHNTSSGITLHILVL